MNRSRSSRSRPRKRDKDVESFRLGRECGQRVGRFMKEFYGIQSKVFPCTARMPLFRHHVEQCRIDKEPDAKWTRGMLKFFRVGATEEFQKYMVNVGCGKTQKVLYYGDLIDEEGNPLY